MDSVNDTWQVRWVSPFGNLRIKACLTAPRSLSQSTTSFIASSCQGIHHVRLIAWPYNLRLLWPACIRGLLTPPGTAWKTAEPAINYYDWTIINDFSYRSCTCITFWSLRYSIHTFVFGMMSSYDRAKPTAVITTAVDSSCRRHL